MNPPIPIEVEESEGHRPLVVRLNGWWVRISRVADIWEINEEWWREKPINRRYYRVVTEDERLITIFRDLVDGGWYRQNP
jgi:hypothetical protein